MGIWYVTSEEMRMNGMLMLNHLGSILCLPMPANVELRITAHRGGYSDPAHHQQCPVI